MANDIKETSILFDEIIRQHDFNLNELASTRMVKLAAHLPDNEYIGWEMNVPTAGLTKMRAFGSKTVKKSDLIWAFENIATFSANNRYSLSTSLKNKALVYQIAFNKTHVIKQKHIGFNINQENNENNDIASSGMPLNFSIQFCELIEALREYGAVFRFYALKASREEQENCRNEVLLNWTSFKTDPNLYIGTPVKTKALLILENEPSLRVRAAIDSVIPGATLEYIGLLGANNEYIINPHIGAKTMPNIAARILALEPYISDETVLSIRCREKKVKPIPASHNEPDGNKMITIGDAIDTSGFKRKISLNESDLRRHWQIIGQTGTGKSTLLASSVISAIKAGYGLTFFDPHGSTIDTILNSVPKKYAKRVQVVRIGDENNPVPLCLWKSNNPNEAEKIINDLNLLFADIFDPNRHGFLGPRWERWFSTFAFAAIAIFGKQASFESINVLSQSKENMNKVCMRIKEAYPELANTIQEEFGLLGSNEFHELISWTLCKLQRLTSVPQLRNTLGAGENAINFEKLLDTNTVMLIDLASPTIGTHASRIIGTLILMQLWNAAMARKNRDKTHLIFIDEAHLFQTNPLPQMLAEGRKFGIGLILAHQHCGQLTNEILDALEANSASFSAFRLSTKDAFRASHRFEDESYVKTLARLDAFNAVTTISVDGKQTAPFTLHIPKLQNSRDSKKTYEAIENHSLQHLVNPYKDKKRLTKSQMQKILDGKLSLKSISPSKEKVDNQNKSDQYPPNPNITGISWLDKWNEYYDINFTVYCEEDD